MATETTYICDNCKQTAIDTPEFIHPVNIQLIGWPAPKQFEWCIVCSSMVEAGIAAGIKSVTTE
jgi:rhodanese-related sulfurtransferase